MSNLSKPYGYYGGVTCENHYVPPPRPAFTPHPPSIPFTKDLSKIFETQLSGSFLKDFLTQNSGSVVFRLLSTNSNNLSSARVFELNTQNNSSDLLTYDTLSSTVDLTILDGGIF